MFYKVKFINNTGVYKTLIVCDKNTQTKLEKTNQIEDDNFEYSNNMIYLDDTIENIKYKITKSIDIDISLNEIYLFAKRKIKYSSKELYDNLSQKQQLPITHAKYLNYLSNFSEININELEKKELYTYDDIIKLNIDNKILTETFPIGIDYNLDTKYPLSINPFTALEDSLLSQKSNIIISTHNNNVLLNYNLLENNTIYVCLASELFSFAKSNYYSKIYFPTLAKQNIYTEQELIRDREKFKLNIDDERAISKYNEKIDFLYKIYNNRKEELPYTNNGINNIEFIIHPIKKTLIPIHTIFRIIETTNKRLLLKYNNKKKTEKIFRLYADKTDINGEKIPVLSKANIHKISDVLGRHRSVSMYYKFDSTELMIELHTNGDIKVIVNSNDTFSITELETYVKTELNELLLDINIVIEKSGYKYYPFTTLYDRHVEIVNLSYKKDIEISKPLDFEEYYKCLTNVFTIIEPDLTKGIEIDYKRIAYYKKMNDIEKYITRKYLQGNTIEEVVVFVSNHFEMSDDESKLKVTEWLQTIEVEQNTFNGKKIKVKNTSGIPIKITKEKFSNKITIQVTNIDQLLYLETIPIFTDVIMRLSQDILDETIDKTELSLLCKGDDTQIKILKDITPPAEKSFEERDAIVIDRGKIKFESQETDDEDGDLFDELFDDDEDGDEDGDIDDIDFEDLGEIGTPDSDEGAFGGAFGGGGGGPKDSKTVDSKEQLTNIDGMSLSNPNIFFDRMYSRDPALFLKQQDGRFQSYSRGCPWTLRKHPVILTDKEKERIDREHPNSYDTKSAFKYGSSPEKEHWYICPRYWCLKDNGYPLKHDEVLDGKCGGLKSIIPYNAKEVPKGHYIFQFNAGTRNNEHMNDDEYIPHHPGFLKPDFHPQGKGVPCCFKYWDKGGQTERRRHFGVPVADEEYVKKTKKTKKTKKKGTVSSEETTEHVQDHLKFPLKHGVIGYLPISIQKMLGTNNDECKRKKTDVYLKTNQPCLLREGVENSNNQSFLACLAAYNTTDTCRTDCNIKSVKSDIKSMLTIDIFVRLQNGSLVEIFYNNDRYKKIDVSKFKTLYGSDTMNIVYQMEKKNINYVKKIISAYLEFHKYIKSDDTKIDHTYLWDFVSSYYFKDEPDGRINLIILEMVEDDITNKVDIVCPTATYSTIKFNTDYKFIIIIKKEEFYEPVCMYKYVDYKEDGNNKSKMELQHNKFSFPNDTNSDAPDVMDGDLTNSIEIIQEKQLNCLIKNKDIQYEESIDIEHILTKIDEMPKYKCVGQVLNYNNKIIGIRIMNNKIDKISKEPIFVPVKPSKILDDIPIYTIDDDIWRGYQTTRDVLRTVGTELEIPCDPMIKVIDSVIVGILTNTNQFVQVSPPSENIHDDGIPEKNIDKDDIPEKMGVKEYQVDSKTIFDDSVDVERENAIKKIKLETNFYTAFRNTFRIVLNKLENYKIKQELIDIIDDYNLFINKINAVEMIIRKMLEPYIIFNILDETTVDMLDKIGLCVERKPGEEKTPYCFTDDRGNVSKLILPKKHLIQKYDNEKIYYGRLADELVRYNKIQNYILNDNTYLNLEQIPYNLHANEIILLESLMYKEYFNKLTTIGKRTEMNNTYDTIMYQDGVDRLVLRSKKDKNIDGKEPIENDICNIDVKSVSRTDTIIKNNPKLKGKIEILIYGDTINCMFQLFIDIIKDATKRIITKREVKEILSKELNILLQTEGDKMKQTFVSQGKLELSSKLEQQENILDLVMSEHYYLSNVDVHILCKHFKINIITASNSTTKLREARDFLEKDKWMFTIKYSADSTHYYVLKQESIKDDRFVKGEYIRRPQIYKLMQHEGRLKFNIKNFSYEFTKLLDSNKVTTMFTKKHAKKSSVKEKLG